MKTEKKSTRKQNKKALKYNKSAKIKSKPNKRKDKTSKQNESTKKKSIHGGNRCLVSDCLSNIYDKNGVLTGMHMFGIPKKPGKRDKWLEFIKGIDVSVNIPKNARICEKHFRPEDIKKETSDGRWLAVAPPSVYVRDENYANMLHKVIQAQQPESVPECSNKTVSMMSNDPANVKSEGFITQDPNLPVISSVQSLNQNEMANIKISNIRSLANENKDLENILNNNNNIVTKDTAISVTDIEPSVEIQTCNEPCGYNNLIGTIIKTEPLDEITPKDSNEIIYKSELFNDQPTNIKYEDASVIINPDQTDKPPKLTAYNTENIKYTCPECGKKLFDRSTYVRHMRVVHSPDHIFPCRYCDKKFDRRPSRKKHERKHTGEKPYECKTCGECFTWNGSYLRHQQIHTGEKPFKCNKCERSFARQSHLETHIASHTGEKKYKCPHCEKSYTDQPGLRRHRKIIHDKLTPYVCNICGKSVTQNASLINHMRIHKGERPFVCTYKGCKMTFVTQSSLQRHDNTHTKKKSFTCEVCGKQLSRKCGLERHYLTHRIE